VIVIAIAGQRAEVDDADALAACASAPCDVVGAGVVAGIDEYDARVRRVVSLHHARRRPRFVAPGCGPRDQHRAAERALQLFARDRSRPQDDGRRLREVDDGGLDANVRLTAVENQVDAIAQPLFDVPRGGR